VGVWIDHRKAIVVTISSKGEELQVIESDVEKQLRRSGDSPLKGRHDPLSLPPEDRRTRAYTGHLDIYYKEVIKHLRDAESILIFGPGAAKGELKKHLEQSNLGECIVGIETADKMTDNQVTAKVRQHFLK